MAIQNASTAHLTNNEVLEEANELTNEQCRAKSSKQRRKIAHLTKIGTLD
jgi:hypothetical protein